MMSWLAPSGVIVWRPNRDRPERTSICLPTMVWGLGKEVAESTDSDKDAGFVPLVYETKRLAFAAGLRQHCTDIISFSHGASRGKKVYKSSFIPGLHDVLTVFERP